MLDKRHDAGNLDAKTEDKIEVTSSWYDHII